MSALKYISFILLICIGKADSQQEALFSSFAFNKNLYIPAANGSEERASIMLVHRNQWSGLAGAPKTQLLSYSDGSPSAVHGWSGQIISSSIGIQKRYDISASYSLGIPINKNRLRIAAQLSNKRYSIDYTSSDILPLDGFIPDPALDKTKISNSTFNLGLSVFYKQKNLYAGIAVSQFLDKEIQIGNPYLNNKEAKHIYAMFGADIDINNSWTYQPQVLYKMAENTPYNLDFLSMFKYKDNLFLGLNIRSGGSQNASLESFDYIIAFQFSDNIFAGMSYDLNVSELSEVENGSLELFMKYRFDKRIKKDSLIQFNPDPLVETISIDSSSLLVEKQAEQIIHKEIKDTLESIDKNGLLSGKTVLFDNIHYDFNSYSILDGAAKELDELSKLMLDNPEINIQLTSHTDSRGTDEYNLELSTNRALSAKTYLVKKGIKGIRITAVGLGEFKILNQCKDNIECTEEEHNFNRRTEVQIVDY